MKYFRINSFILEEVDSMNIRVICSCLRLAAEKLNTDLHMSNCDLMLASYINLYIYICIYIHIG